MSKPPISHGLGNLGNLGGAFDLSSLKQPPLSLNSEDLGYVVTQENLISELLPASHEAVAILLCWSPRSSQAQSLLPMLRQFNREDLTSTGDPRWIFGSVNVDAQPAVAKALQVQSVPLAIAIIQEQLVPLFESVPPADQVRAVIDKVLELAEQKGVGNSVTKKIEKADEIEPEEQEAIEALAKGDFLSAKAAYERWVKASPTNSLATLGLAQVELMVRIDGVDSIKAIAEANASPENVELQIRAADCEVAQGDFEVATNRLIAAVKSTSGEERKKAREHLLVLFTLLEVGDSRLASARQKLASALY